MINIDINRITVSLHGVSAQEVESAVNDLEGELQRRLGSLPTGDAAAVDIGELSLGSIHSTAVLDGDALRGIIAERLVGAISAQFADTAPAGIGSPATFPGGD